MPRLSCCRISSFAIPFLILAADVLAGPVTGRIVDPAGRPITGAQVLAVDAGVVRRAVVTSSEGRFTLPLGEGEPVTLRVSADGFTVHSVVVQPADEARDVGTIALRVGALSESVVVSATQVDVPLTQVGSSVTIITEAELQARQLHSVSDALRTVPGLSVAATGGPGATTGVFPRGGESNFTLVLVDGVPVNTFGGDYDFGHLSTAGVERIEIVRGPQSALFGSNAIGAVVRIVTRRGGAPGAQFTAEGGGYGTSRLSGSTAGSRGRFEWGGLFEQLLTDGRSGDRSAAGEEILNDDYERRTGGLSAGWRDGSTTLSGHVRHPEDERGVPGPFGSNPIGAFGGIDAVSRGDNRRTLTGGTFGTAFSPALRLDAQGVYHRLVSDFVSPFGVSEFQSDRWGGRVQLDADLARSLDVSAGVDLQGEDASSTYITGARAQAIPVERRTAGYFGEARWRSADRLFVTAGVRLEHLRRERLEDSPDPFSPRPVLPADTVLSLNPRLSAAWLVRTNGSAYTRVRGAAGTGIRPPDGFELAFTDNPGLRPERSVSLEAGVDQAFAAGRGLVEATAFFNEYDDLIIAVGSFRESSRYRTDNIANARASGLELGLTLRGRLPGKRPIDVGGRLGYTLLDTTVQAVDRTRLAPPPFSIGQPLLRRPRHQFSADLSLAAGPLSAFLRGGGRSEVLDVEPSFGTFGGLFDAAGYGVWHAGAAYRIARALEVFGRVENVADRAYEEAFGFPALGRRTTVGLRVAAGR